MIQIETHDDDSVTLTVGTVVAHVTADSWKEANDAAYALGAFVAGRAELDALHRRITNMRSVVRDVEQSLDAVEHHMRSLAEYSAVPVSTSAKNGDSNG